MGTKVLHIGHDNKFVPSDKKKGNLLSANRKDLTEDNFQVNSLEFY